MHDSMAQPQSGLAPLELSGWKTAASWTAAVVLSILFIVSGVWKITDVQAWAQRLAQAKVPESLSVAGTLFFGIAETVAGAWILVPRLRRWGALLTALLLIAFLGYFAIHYTELRGQDCSCFPWLKRAVGPNFFIGDGVMLLLALAAWAWSKPASGRRTAVLVAGAVAVFAGVSYGVDVARQTGAPAPASITVNGQPFSLEHGKTFVYFFNPQCMHCYDAAKRMSHLKWGDTRVVAVPVEVPQYAQQFLQETGLQAGVSPDFESLKKVFHYTAYPYGMAVENGRQKAPLTKFEGAEPEATLRQLGFVY